MIIPKVETWKIQDSSKIQTFQTCARQYFFQHVLGWRGEESNIHLVFGQAVHFAMEKIYKVGSKPDFSPETIVDAYDSFLAYYRESFPEYVDDENAPKNPANFFDALPLYASTYRPIDTFYVLHTEVAGSVMVSDDRQIYFKVDIIARGKAEGIFCLEHKTGTRFSTKWAQKWTQKTQIGTYAYLISMMYPDEPTYGVRVNGLFIKNPPKLKRDGTPYSGSTSTEFHRVPIQKTILQLEDWLWNINFWLEFIEIEFDNLDKVEMDDDIMFAFPKNPESCDKFYGCPYRDYCVAWLNPLRKCDEPPLGFMVEHWDPRSKQEEAKEVVEL